VVGRAVDDARDRPDLRCRQVPHERRQDGDAAADRGLEAQRCTGPPRQPLQRSAARREERLVGGDHSAATLERRSQQPLGGVQATQQLHHDVEVGSSHDCIQVARGLDGSRHSQSAGAARIARADGHQLQRSTAPATHAVTPARVQQRFGHRSSDRAQAEEPDPKRSFGAFGAQTGGHGDRS